MKPNLDYRANPHRAIFVQGRIDDQLINRVTPEILRLQHDSRDPITVYIDSPGGLILYGEILSKILTSSNQSFEPGCRIITQAVGLAASAAADLLCSGSYATALPHSIIYFHGGRRSAADAITVTVASEIVESLRLTNDRFALALAERALPRIGIRFCYAREGFDEYRKTVGELHKTDVGCFTSIVKERLSPQAMRVVDRALQRNERYLALAQNVGKRVARSSRIRNAKRIAVSEAEILKAIIDYELRMNKGENWTFGDVGLGQINVDFLLVREYLNIYDSSHLRLLCDLFADWFLSDSDRDKLEVIHDKAERTKARAEKVKPFLRPLWMFFIALCYSLQESENELTAEDAYWLGLIDEVVGRLDLLSSRVVLEEAPDAESEERAATTKISAQSSPPAPQHSVRT